MRTILSLNYPKAITAVIYRDNTCPERRLFKTDASSCFNGTVVLLFCLLLVVSFSLGVNAATAGPGAGPTPLVTVARVIEQDVNPSSEYVGHVEAMSSDRGISEAGQLQGGKRCPSGSASLCYRTGTLPGKG